MPVTAPTRRFPLTALTIILGAAATSAAGTAAAQDTTTGQEAAEPARNTAQHTHAEGEHVHHEGGSHHHMHHMEVVYVTAGAPARGDALRQAAAVDVLAGLEKDRREGASLGQTLEHLPGVRTLDTGNNVGLPVIRGLTGNRIRLLSNGVGVDNQQYGIRHQPNIDPFLTERIEVVRGAASILYGSDALGGSIDVRSLPLEFTDHHRHVHGDARLAYFDNNEQSDIGLRLESPGERLSFAGGLIYRDGGDIRTPDDPTGFESGDRDAPAYNGRLPFTDFEQLNTQLGAGLRTAIGDFSLRYNGWRNEQNLLLNPAPGSRAPRGIGVDLANDEWQLEGRMALGTGWTLRPTFTWQNNLRRANDPGNPRSGLFDGSVELEFDQYTARLEAVHESLGFFDRGTLGFEVRRKEQESRGRSLLSPGGEVEALGLFAFEERRFGRLLLQAGLRHDWLDIAADADRSVAQLPFEGTQGNDYSVTTGSLGGSYDLSENLVLAVNVGRGFRAPTLFELFANGVHGGVAAVQIGNAELDPEESLNTDLALRWRSERLTASATVFSNRIDDYIYLFGSGEVAGNGLPIFRHAQDDAVLNGVELFADVHLSDTVELTLAYDRVESENDATGEELPMQPADQLRAELGWYPVSLGVLREPWVRVAARHVWSRDAVPGEPFAQFNNNPVFGSANTDSYTVADLSAGFELGASASNAVSVMLDVRNLFDEAYRDFLYTYKAYAFNPGRDIRLTVRVPFSW